MGGSNVTFVSLTAVFIMACAAISLISVSFAQDKSGQALD
jgi:hypothetical protein